MMFTAVVGVGASFMSGVAVMLVRHMAADAKVTESLRKELSETHEKVSRELADYKLSATREFASVGHLQEVESRLVKHLDKIEGLIERGLRLGNPHESRT